MIRKMLIALYIVIFVAILILAYIRFAPANVSAIHVDPASAQSTGKSNAYLLIGERAPVFAHSADEMAKLVDDFVMTQPRVTRLAGSAGDKMITYVQRSLIMGYPDFITIKVIALDNGQSKLRIFSQSRFGHSDMGVNKQRIGQWMRVLRD